ncbi:hypothetical protein G2W53_040052 [Senna tora]|uniref:Uncharacterized protein n=3 Tax=Senna tora TaxID=362788 RepID=A0A834W6Q4_9FABA|nr:hypothetical protein G2W53_040052 [Senna tora]
MPRPFGINCLAIVGRGRGDMLPFDGNGPSLRRERSDEVMPIQRAIQSSGDILCGMMGTGGLASRLLVVVAVIGCHLMATARPFGEALERVITLGDSREGSDEVMPIQKAIQSCGEILCGMMGIEGLASRLLAVVAAIGCHLMETARPFEMLSIREVCKWLSLGSTCLALLDYLHWMSPFARVSLRTWDVVCFGGVGRCSTFRRVSGFWIFVLAGSVLVHRTVFVEVPPFLPKGINSLGVVIIVRSMPLCCLPIDAEVVFVKILGRRLPSSCKDLPGITPGRGVGGATCRKRIATCYSLFDGIYYSDNRSNSRANTCNKPRLAEGMHLLDKRSTRALPVALMIHDNSTDRTATVPATHHSNFCPINFRCWTLGWVDRSASGVHRSARPFCRRCAPGLNWPGRASGAVTLKKLECSKQAYALDTLAWDNIIGF